MSKATLNILSITDELDYIYCKEVKGEKYSIEEYKSLCENKDAEYKNIMKKTSFKDIYENIKKESIMRDILKFGEATVYGSPPVFSYNMEMNIFGLIRKPRIQATIVTCSIKDLPARIMNKQGHSVKFRLRDFTDLLSVTDAKDYKKIELLVVLSRFLVYYAAMFDNMVADGKKQDRISCDNNTVSSKLINFIVDENAKKLGKKVLIPLKDWYFKFAFPTQKKNKDDKSNDPEKIISPYFKFKMHDLNWMTTMTVDGKTIPKKDKNGAYIYKPYLYEGQPFSLENMHKVMTPGSSATSIIDMSTLTSSSQGIHAKSTINEMILLQNRGNADELDKVDAEEMNDAFGMSEDDLISNFNLESAIQSININKTEETSESNNNNDIGSGFKLTIPPPMEGIVPPLLSLPNIPTNIPPPY
jgi:hypothetical protein